MEFEKTGRCTKCNTPCYIECGACYALLHEVAEEHRCPVREDEGFFEEDVQLCDVCSELEDEDC